MGPELSAAEQAQLDAATREMEQRLDAHISENPDGTLVVKLERAIDDEHGRPQTRVTVRRVKVRDVRRASVAADALRTDELAASLVPIYDDLESDADRLAVLRATDRQLGKYLSAGS